MSQSTISLPSLPLWQEFPELELYMDQIVSLGNRYLSGLTQTTITPAMVNSYVKKGLISRPIKKRYTCAQLGQLLLVSLFKSVYSLDIVEKLLPPVLDQITYDEIATKFNTILTCQQVTPLNSDLTTLALQTVIFKCLTLELCND